MKTELENFRKYNLSDFLVNIKKFKDYLEYCKKKNLSSEKKALIENIIKTIQEKRKSLQDKKNSQNTNIITDYINLCAFAIIFSDFEVELFFEIEHFNPELQKDILFHTLNYCCDRQKELQNYISNKFQYWILKMKNHNYVTLKEAKDSKIEAEIQESIESLKKCINQELLNHIEDNVKILYLKIIYELSIYYYFNDNYQDSIKYLKFLEKNMKIYQALQKALYFDLSSITNLLKYLNESRIINNKNDNKVNNKINNIESKYIIESDDINEFIDEDYRKYSKEINDIKEIKLNALSVKNLEEPNKKGILKYLKILEYLFYMTFENINNNKEINKFINRLMNISEEKLNKSKSKEENDYIQYFKKELLYFSTLFQILESMINNKNKLPKDFIFNLSDFIVKNTFTDNLSLSGLIHSSLTNFVSEYKIIYKYFNKFVDFFKGTNSIYKKEMINQVIFIARIISVFFIILDSKEKINSLEEKEIIVNIEKELHVNIINIFLFWLEKDVENKNELKYPPSINIIYILIETLKIVDFLKIYKIVIIDILEFLLDKKQVKSNEKKLEKDNNDINNYIKQIKQKIFKIKSLSEEELKQNKKIINNKNLYYSIKVNFVEAKGKDKYFLKNNEVNITFYIKKLFEIIELIDNKLKEYENKNYNIMIFDDQNNKSYDNLKLLSKLSEKKDFLYYYFYKILLESDNKKYKFTNLMLIKKGINYLKLSLSEIEIIFMKIDMNNNPYQINKIYELFKKNLNQEILAQLIICLIENNLLSESIVLIQYSKLLNNLEYKLIKSICEDKKSFNNECFKFIWKITYFEYFANIFNKNNDKENLENIKNNIKKVGNHRFFKEHPLRKHLKIINFFNFLDYIESNIF